MYEFQIQVAEAATIGLHQEALIEPGIPKKIPPRKDTRKRRPQKENG